MNTPTLVVLTLATVLVVTGMVVVVVREITSHAERRVVSRARDLAEVLAPLIGAVILLIFVWRSA